MKEIFDRLDGTPNAVTPASSAPRTIVLDTGIRWRGDD